MCFWNTFFAIPIHLRISLSHFSSSDLTFPIYFNFCTCSIQSSAIRSPNYRQFLLLMSIPFVFSQLIVIPFIALSFTISCSISVFLCLPSTRCILRILRTTPPLWNPDRTFRSVRIVLPLNLNKSSKKTYPCFMSSSIFPYLLNSFFDPCSSGLFPVRFLCYSIFSAFRN